MKIVNNSNYDLTGVSLNIPALRDFEQKILNMSVESAQSNLKKVKNLAIKLDTEDDCLYADVQIVICYLEKLAAIASNIADKDLFREINLDAKNYYKMHSYIDSKNLLEVLAAAGVSTR